ncbi:transposase [Streptosporangium nondiastaticum]|uniref:Transposase n=1 Tax=Streptosporangium nondiastaticum TaxID=35764 RepID=A0A9X7JN67_9ACTN|nr:RNA-guided endonuclease TnpB family protein [Streptosporangium nondiastaticum]PSJ26653.1 transposase [Streptosporangium nondiastaticum]
MKGRTKEAGTRERTYRYRFYPTAAQAEQLAKTFGACRWVYNQGLELRNSSWEQHRVSIGYTETCRALTGWRRAEETSWLREVSSAVLQQSLRHLDKAFSRFFRGGACRPKRKKKGQAKDSATYVRTGFRWFEDPERPGTGLFHLAKHAEPLDLRWSRPLPAGALPVKVTVTRDRAGRYFLLVLVEERIAALPPAVTPAVKAVGLDLGITHLVTLDDGTKTDHPRLLRRYRARLATLQRQLHRKKRGSSNRNKARLAIARLYARISDIRKDMLDQLTTRLVRENQVLVVEDLDIAGMKRDRPGMQARRKARLNEAISDAGWSELLRQLTYKAEWYGRTLVVVDRHFPSTRRCSACHTLSGPKELSVRVWTCALCGTERDRDVNAAINLREEGLRLYELVVRALPTGKTLPSVIRAADFAEYAAAG